MFSEKPLPANLLIVDQTAVGDPVVRSRRRAEVRGGFKCVVITKYESGIWQVPMKDLVGTLQVLLQEQRLKIAAQLSDVPSLIEELLNFQMKPAPLPTDPLAAWREAPQHDLLFAMAMAAWWVERAKQRLFVWP